MSEQQARHMTPLTKHRVITSQMMRPAVAAALAGIIIGIAGWLLKLMVATVSRLVTSGFDIGSGNWWLIGVPVVGIVIVGLFVRKIVRWPLEQGTQRLEARIDTGDATMPRRLTFSSMIASALTLGFGGSAGSEGPIAYTGAAIGSNIARAFGLDNQKMLVFLACGAGAGIAAIFKAPIGGMFFTIEVLQMPLGVPQTLMLATMCLLSGLMAYLFSGGITDMVVTSVIDFDLSMLPVLIVFGLIAGVYSAYYRYTGLKAHTLIRRVSPPVVRNTLSGLLIGLLLFLFPALYGEGYAVLGNIADNHLNVVTNGSVAMLFHNHNALVWVLGGILLVKSIACYLTNSGGGVAGDFAPALFAGGIAGAFVAALAPYIPLFEQIPTGVLVISGMAAVMAGVVRAPIMTIFLVVEMTHQAQMLLPAATVAAISCTISTIILPTRR